MQPKILLAQDTIDENDVNALIEWLKTYPRLTKGEQTILFEQQFAAKIKQNYAVFVNSGSSANLLLLYALLQGKYLRNNKIVIPNLSWITDIAPAMQLGFDPILVDVNLEDLSADLVQLECIFRINQPACFLLVSVLGLVPNMEQIYDLCRKYNVQLILDNCEGLGSVYQYLYLENYALASTCSLYYGHHLSTIEGGMITTDDEQLYIILKMLRSHGWTRDLTPNEKHNSIAFLDNQNDAFNELYRFYYPAFNLRSTDLQAFLGLRQLDKWDYVVKKRNANYKLFNQLIINDFWKPVESDDRYVSNLGYPVISKNRTAIVEHLQREGVEVRPLICGSMSSQPFYQKQYKNPDLFTNSLLLNQYGMYLPNHPYLTMAEIEKMAAIVNKYTQ